MIKEGFDGNSGVGRQLIIIHAITDCNVFAERDKFGIPVSDLEWNGDTPHSTP